MERKTFILSLLLITLFSLGYSPASATSEVSLSSGIVSADYAETTDSQSATLSGSSSSVAFRSIEALSFLDLGLEWGNYSLKGNSSLHKVTLSTDYVGLIAGISFGFYPRWLEYTLDLGYRLGVDRMKLDRSRSSGQINQHKIGNLNQEPFIRLGIKIFLGQSLFLGLNFEQQGKLFKKEVEGLTPQVSSANSTLLTLGYRFGGGLASSVVPVKAKRGATNYNNPCRLFSACE